MTSWPRPRILLFVTLDLMSSWSHPLMPLSMVSYRLPSTNYYSAPSELFVSAFPRRSFIILVLRVCLSLLVCERKGWLAAPFLSGCGWSSPLIIHPLWKRIVVFCGSGLTFSGRLRRLCCLRGNARSIRSAQSTFSSSYLRDVTHRHLDTFSIGPVVADQQVV